MKKISGLIMLPLLLVTLTACGPSVVSGTEQPPVQTKVSVSEAGKQTKPNAAHPKTKPSKGSTGAQSTVPVTQAVTSAPAVTGAAATTAAAGTAATDTATTLPVTVPVQTQPSSAEGSGKGIKSNLPAELKKAADEPGIGMLVIYEPQLYKGIRQAVTWDVRTYDTNTKVLAVIKHKGSKVEALDSEMAEEGPFSVPGKVIRSWKTTSDYEVIRLYHTDPPSFVQNFIRVREPDGHVTTAPIESSGREVGSYLAIPYDAE